MTQLLVTDTVADLDRDAWDALDHGQSPFLRHGFLRALEESGSIGQSSGWDPRFIVDGEGKRIRGAVCAFVKYHSYGEFIFDWAWARASEQAGLRYYPKLVVAAPFTPASGPRLLLARDLSAAQRDEVCERLVAATLHLADADNLSSVHFLFTLAEEQERLTQLGFANRDTMQFHWHNRGYTTFDDYLAAMTSRRRKQARKERSRAQQAVDSIRMIPGAELTTSQIDVMDRFYRQNVDAHYSTQYLEPGFFQLLARYSADDLRVAIAERSDEPVAGALFMEGEGALFGRYWGADAEIPFLHFEMTSWMAIEYCIERGLGRYEAGAQGGHKLLRGLEPSRTYSAHWIRHPGLDQAIRQFLAIERAEMSAELDRLAKLGPFKES